MPEGSRWSGEGFMEAGRDRDRFLSRIVELERELMKARRTEKVLHEMEQRYLSLMDSGVFLFVVMSPSGLLRVMNRRAEEFFGFQSGQVAGTTLQSLAGTEYAVEVESLLMDTAENPIHASLPLTRADGSVGWLEMELSWSVYQGEPSILLIGAEVAEPTKGSAEAQPLSPPPEDDEYGPGWALRTLASCPGLLCFAVDMDGVLLYATRGYREVVKRFRGHECVPGLPYPGRLETAFEKELDALIRSAFRGDTMTMTLAERGGGVNLRWNMMVAPLMSSRGEISGAVAHLTSLAQPGERVSEKPSSPSPKPRDEEAAFSQTELLNAVCRMLVVLDGRGDCVEANACFLRTLKFRREDVVGRPFADLVMKNDPLNEGVADRILRMAGRAFSEEIECKICGRDGEVFSLSLNGAPVRWERSAATLVSCADNTKLRRTEEQLRRMSATDSSTGTLNRHGMERALGTEIERAIRYRGSLSIIVLDVDGFRGLNERIGYAASDRVLKELAAALKSRIRSTDFLGRWGGDEFMILTPSPAVAAWQSAEALRDMAEHMTFGGDVRLTLSAGVAEFRKDMDISAFVARAWDAMVEAKRSGGNRSVQAGQPDAPELSASPAE